MTERNKKEFDILVTIKEVKRVTHTITARSEEEAVEIVEQLYEPYQREANRSMTYENFTTYQYEIINYD